VSHRVYFDSVLVFLAGLLLIAASSLTAEQTIDPRVEKFRKVPLKKKLDSPRHTIETLCFAIDAYDRIPVMIDEAVDCLDFETKNADGTGARPLLAIQLYEILDELSFPFRTLIDDPKSQSTVFFQDNEVRIALSKRDGLWRFDRETVERIPAMHRVMEARAKQRRTVSSQLKSGLEDPTATLVSFLDFAAAGDYESAALRLNLADIPLEQRHRLGPYLAWKLACVMQRRGYLYSPDLPIDPDGLPYTWSTDAAGRIRVERIHRPGGKDTWQFSRGTVAAIEAMWREEKDRLPDVRYALLGKLVPPPPDHPPPALPLEAHRPDTVPDDFASPRRMVRAFFRAVDEAEYDDAAYKQAYVFLDLGQFPVEDHPLVGPKRVAMLEAVLRKINPDLATLSDHWSAPPQVLSGPGSLRVEIVRQTDGRWRFSGETVAGLPAMYESLGGKDRVEGRRLHGLGTPRETLSLFLTAVNQRDNAHAARCLDLSELPPSVRDNVGPVLAFKLKYVIDRLGRVYLQEVPNDADGPHFVLYRGPVGRIVLGPRDGPDGKVWTFTADTVAQIESMFDRVLGQPADTSLAQSKHTRLEPELSLEPGVWIRAHAPTWLRRTHLGLEDYQWLALAMAIVLAWAGSLLLRWLALRLIHWSFHLGDAAADLDLLRLKLRSLRALAFVVVFYWLIEWTDLPSAWAGRLYLLEKLLLTAVLAWLGFQWTDLGRLFYERTSRLKSHRGLGDLLVPFITTMIKLVVVLSASTYLVYQFGQGDSVTRFFTGLGIVGVAVSLAAQDSLKNFFGTLVLIGDRAFRIGDRLVVGDKEGIVEQVGFRSTKLRTFDDSLLVLPNGLLAGTMIDNLGLRIFRRIRLLFWVAIATPLDRLDALRDAVRSHLCGHPRVDSSRVHVHVHRIAESGIEWELWCYFEASDLEGEAQGREELLCEILRLASSLQVELVLAKK
jgi:MscS family membrane protein